MVRSAAMKSGVEYSEQYVPEVSLADEDEALKRLEKLSHARPAIARLDRQEQFVLEQYIVLDRSRADVAAELGVTPSRISQISSKILLKIKAAVEEGG